MMRMRLWLIFIVALVTALPAQAQVKNQDPELLRFASRALSWYPDSSFEITRDERRMTASGAYRLVTVERSCASQYLSGPTSFLIDEVTSAVFIGQAASLPTDAAGGDPSKVKAFVEGFLPQALLQGLRQRARVEWASGARAGGAVMRIDLHVDSGYGEYNKPAAVTADGKVLMLGVEMPLDRDPVEYRRELLNGADLVIWDHESSASTVEIVEFSDLECPACKRKWPLIKETLKTHGQAVKHGMVGFPLPNIHPWAFRAACATWCLAQQDAHQVLEFKELFYSLQKDMEVSDVTPTSTDFVAGKGLDEEAFRACYLRDPSVTAVHGQLGLGHVVGVQATPTYVVNGWLVQMPEEAWFGQMIERLVAGRDP